MELIPDIEENIPVPLRSVKVLEQSPQDELNSRVNTIKLLSDLQGKPLVANSADQDMAQGLAKQMLTDPQIRPEFAKYRNETMAYLAGMIAQSNVQLVDELSELKMYVVNKLVFEVENAASPKDRISALSKLGEVDGVDAFKKRSEMTVKVKPIEEVEKELLGILDNIEYQVVSSRPKPMVGVDDAEIVDADEDSTGE